MIDTRSQITATLVLAFSADPVSRWLFPRVDQYLTYFPEFVYLVGLHGFGADTADRDDEGRAAALWVPPDAAHVPDGPFIDLLQRGVDPSRHDVVGAFLEEMSAQHPGEPHWYLPFIGVDPRHQGMGLGSGLLKQGIVRCDVDGEPAYLEATSPANRALYERHGFHVITEMQAADSPPVWPMRRPERDEAMDPA